jgi:hypothetical protein
MNFEVGKIYNTLSGHTVRVTRISPPGFFQSSDGRVRFNDPSHAVNHGRVVGSSKENPDHGNLVVPAVKFSFRKLRNKLESFL